MSSAEPQDLLTRFGDFVVQAGGVIERSSPPAPVEGFEEFIRSASEVIVEEVQALLPSFREFAARVRPWVVEEDLLAVAKVTGHEDPYTELVGWLLDPETHEDTALRRQHAWLRAACLDDSLMPTSACKPRTQVLTDDGIPDLILAYDGVVVVVEAKVWSLEHTAPSGEWQTEAYPTAIRKKMGLSSSTHVHTVFLTPDGHDPVNRRATPTTYVRLVRAIVEEVDPEEIPASTRVAMGMVVTHFLRHATPAGVDIVVLWAYGARALLMDVRSNPVALRGSRRPRVS